MQRNKFIGREEEQEILRAALSSNEPEMVAVLGRRRVGKTFLIKETYKNEIVFEITGLQEETTPLQLQHFGFTLNQYQKKESYKRPENWLEAFQQLVLYLDQFDFKEKKVVFIDELPWLASGKNSFLTGLGFFWNSWAVNKNMVVVICGSAASWMIEKVVNNRGSLHNRITKMISLEPFTLKETETFLKKRNIGFNRRQIVELYMALGGIPHYLKEVKSGESAVQNIDRICFTKTGLLQAEFSRLYLALFSKAERHISVIRAMSTSRQGLPRKEIVRLASLPEGGGTTRIFRVLEQSGFITSYYPFGKKKKEKLFRLTDEYSLFYLQFIEKKKKEGKGTWQHLSQTQQYKIWSGYAFENICLKHIPQIKKALGIAGVYSESSPVFRNAAP